MEFKSENYTQKGLQAHINRREKQIYQLKQILGIEDSQQYAEKLNLGMFHQKLKKWKNQTA